MLHLLKLEIILNHKLTVTNSGPNEANLVKVYDWLDHRLIFISSSTDNGSYDNNTGIWDIGNISSDEIANLTIIVQLMLYGCSKCCKCYCQYFNSSSS